MIERLVRTAAPIASCLALASCAAVVRQIQEAERQRQPQAFGGNAGRAAARRKAQAAPEAKSPPPPPAPTKPTEEEKRAARARQATACEGYKLDPEDQVCLRFIIEEDLWHWSAGDGDTAISSFATGNEKDLSPLRGLAVGKPPEPPRECAFLSGIASMEDLADPLALRAACILVAWRADAVAWGDGKSSIFGNTIARRTKDLAAFRSEEGFQAARWGMTRAEVRRAFPRAKKIGETLGLSMRVADVEAGVVFMFAEDRLVRVVVASLATKIDPAAHVDEYIHFRKLLDAKYGAPAEAEDDVIGLDAAGDIGVAVYMDQRELAARWETGKTTIALQLEREDAGLRVAIVYDSAELAQLRERAGEAERERKLGEL